MNDINVTRSEAPEQVVVGGVVLAVREGNAWIVRLPLRPNAADLKAVNKALGAVRFRQAKGYTYLDGKSVGAEVRVSAATAVPTGLTVQTAPPTTG